MVEEAKLPVSRTFLAASFEFVVLIPHTYARAGMRNRSDNLDHALFHSSPCMPRHSDKYSRVRQLFILPPGTAGCLRTTCKDFVFTSQ
jgi:hypothetical protein